MFTDLINQFLLFLEPERAHHLALNALQIVERTSLLCPPRYNNIKPIRLMGLSFPNPIGLAAGLDKNGDYIDALAALGFGFIEIGTVTPKPQPGNPTPRLFRLPEKKELEALSSKRFFSPESERIFSMKQKEKPLIRRGRGR